MKILITGGNGFIARSLFENLSEIYDVEALGREELDLLNDKLVYSFINKKQFDVIIHTANYDAAPVFSIKDPGKVLENNLRMFFNLARCSDFFGKMIYFGSGAEFGRENWVPKMSEQFFDKYVPIDQYGLSKYIMTKYALKSENIFNLRLFGTYGKYDDWRYRLIPNLCCRAAFGLPLVINQNKAYDYLYIEDLISVVLFFIKNSPKNKVYNVCSGMTYRFSEIAENISKLSDCSLGIIFKTNGYGIEYSGDNSLLKNEIGNLKVTDMNYSLDYLYQWFKLNLNQFDKSCLLK